MKILFVLTYPKEDPASRFRVFQFIPYLKERGLLIDTDIIFPSIFYKLKNKKNIFIVFFVIVILMFSLLRRLFRIPTFKKYDIVYVQREIFPFFTPFIEKIACKLSKKFIFDFDDAIFISPSMGKQWRDYLRNPANISKVCAFSDQIVVSNSYLADYARKFSINVNILPTVYNINYNSIRNENKIPIIGWIGSWTTLYYLDIIKPTIEKLNNKYKFIFKIIGAENIYNFKLLGVPIEYILWDIENEQKNISSLDIGLMPLYNSEWEKGKCGFKLIQYMSFGKAVVASPVGENLNIVKHGYNGYLARDTQDWENYLEILLKDPEKRKKIGNNALTTIKENYSFKKKCDELYDIITS